MKFQQISFQFCGALGLLCGAPLAIKLARAGGLSPWIEAVLIAVALFMLLATPLTMKVFTGRENLVLYRDGICIFAAVALTLRWLHQPVLPYLDVTVAGAGLFHAWGRLGCLLAGCCYGRPSRLGVRYTGAHAVMGFPLQLTGVRLFPIQAVESAWVLGLAVGAAWMVVRHAVPGSAFAAYVAGYALGRFFFEFARGDADRPYFLRISQSQWISLLLTVGLSLLGLAGVPRYSIWLSVPFVVLAVSIILVALARKFEKTSRFELLHPRHTSELAELLRRTVSPAQASPPPLRTSARQPAIKVKQTSLGVRISVGEIPRDGVNLLHYCLSKEGEPLSRKDLRLLARQISLMRHDGAPFRCVHGKNGATHLLF